MSLRRPTNHTGSNATGTPFGTSGLRNCMTCNKWRPPAGGGKDPRTGFWRCACCTASRELGKAAGAANWQSAKIERADASLDDLHAELTNDMERALAGLQTHVPGFDGYGSVPREVLKSPADQVVSAMDRMTCAEALMLVLKDSTCPLVAKLRREVVAGYVAENADGIAEARGLA